jgi:hypothetical protein
MDRQHSASGQQSQQGQAGGQQQGQPGQQPGQQQEQQGGQPTQPDERGRSASESGSESEGR